MQQASSTLKKKKKSSKGPMYRQKLLDALSAVLRYSSPLNERLRGMAPQEEHSVEYVSLKDAKSPEVTYAMPSSQKGEVRAMLSFLTLLIPCPCFAFTQCNYLLLHCSDTVVSPCCTDQLSTDLGHQRGSSKQSMP